MADGGLRIKTDRLALTPEGPGHLKALMESAEAYEERFGIGLAEGVREFLTGGEVSPEFLAKLESAAAEPDPWTFGFTVVHRADEVVIGMAGFKGPPDDGLVEIAYGIAPSYQGRGYATEAAQALIGFAKKEGGVAEVRAHTLPETNASTRVLEKCGFRKVGEVTDPEDGLVLRWVLRFG